MSASAIVVAPRGASVASRALIARILAPVTFASRRRIARQLFKFALAEQESMLELRAAAAQCSSPERRAQYLRHALDEERHASMFAAHAADIRRSLGLPGWGAPRTGSEDLFERLGEVRFLAFVHRGERRGRVQFEVYARYFAARGDDKLRALFQALVADEREHERYTLAYLAELSGDAGAELRWVGAWEALRAWRRLGQASARVFYVASMTLLYLTLLPFATYMSLARPDRRGAWRE